MTEMRSRAADGKGDVEGVASPVDQLSQEVLPGLVRPE